MTAVDKHRELAFARGTLGISLSCSFILLLLLLGRTFAFTPVSSFVKLLIILLLAIPACGFFSWWLAGALFRRRKSIAWLLIIAALNLVLVLPEIGLRLIDFRFESGIQFGYPRPHEFIGFAYDEKLFWKLSKSAMNVNSLGFPGKMPEIPKRNKVVRLIFLGDSCTQQGYPTIVENLLNARRANYSQRFEAVTLAVSGYSSYQGRILAEDYVPRLEPDIVLVYFGWNDHWRAYGQVDSEKKLRPSELGPLRSIVMNSRAFQFCFWLAEKIAGGRRDLLESARVPPDEYRENLMAIRTVCDKRGVPAVFITAPTSHYKLGVPDHLVEQKFIPDEESVMAIHRRYNSIAREIASHSNAFLLDLEKKFASIADQEKIFNKDGIHFTDSGLALVAAEIVGFLEDRIFAAGEDNR